MLIHEDPDPQHYSIDDNSKTVLHEKLSIEI